MDISIYSKYVNDNSDGIAEAVNQSFEVSKDFIKAKIIKELRSYLTPVPTHYEWNYDGNPYDYSGSLSENGLISLDLTINEFLENEYTGASIATYESRRGFRFETYGESLSSLTLDIGSEIMHQTIRLSIEHNFKIELSEDDIFDIGCYCNSFDEIYDNCIASDFFFSEGAVEFCGIGDYKLRALVKKDTRTWEKQE